MGMRPTLFTISGLATETQLDRRAVAKRLGSTPPDGRIGTHQAWYLSTFLKACGADRALRRRDQPEDHGQDAADLAELKAADAAVREGLQRLRREPDIEVRRRLAETIGPTVGRLERAFRATTAGMPDDERCVVQPFIDRQIGSAISEFLTLCEWELERA